MPDEKERASRREQVEKLSKILGVGGKTLSELSGPSSASIVAPPVQGRAPAQVTAPPPFSMGRTPGTAPSLEGLAPQQRSPITPGGLQTGLEFGTKGGRNAAIVTGAISSISQFLDRREKKKKNESRERVSGAIRIAQNFIASGDKEGLTRYLMNMDDKTSRELQKALQLAQKPKDETPPEVAGIQDAFKEGQEKDAEQAQKEKRIQMIQQTLMPRPSSQAQLGSALPENILRAVRSGQISREQFFSLAGRALGMKPGQFEEAMNVASGGVSRSLIYSTEADAMKTTAQLNQSYNNTTRMLKEAMNKLKISTASAEKIAGMRARISETLALAQINSDNIKLALQDNMVTLELVKQTRSMEKELRGLAVEAEKGLLSDELTDDFLKEADRQRKLGDKIETQLRGRISAKTGLERSKEGEEEVVPPSRPKDEFDIMLEESMVEGAR